MSAVYDPATVARFFADLDNDYDEELGVYISVAEGGSGTTSASLSVELHDPETEQRQIYRVAISLPKPGDDDYVSPDS